MRWKLHCSILSMLWLVTACSETTHLTFDNPAEPDLAGGSFTLPVPRSVVDARAVDLDALYALVTVNGEERPVLENGTYTTTFSAANGSTLNISASWFERQNDRQEDLLLASWSTSQVVDGNTTIDMSADDYVTTGAAGGPFDFDGDDFSNLLERQENSNPFNEFETPMNRADVRIPWINPNEAPVIDGLYDSVWTGGAQFDDVAGDRLSIDNLMINQGARRNNGSAELRWFAMHDDSNLYVFVLGENVDVATPFRDSEDMFHDDNVNLYIDGNNSKGSAYDGVDDRHLFAPLLTDPANPTQNSTVYDNGFNSAPIPAFEFATCLCSTGQHTWEFKLPLSEFNITKGAPFGFDVQIDLDHDGGARDARWGWFHPARTTEDIDNTWSDPSFMGTAILD